MSDKLSKFTQIISATLFILAILFAIIFYYGVMTMETMPESIVIPAEKVAWTMENLGSSLINFIYVVYGLAFLAIIATLGFSILNIFTNAKTAKRSLVSIAALGAVVLIAYILASPEIPIFFGYERFNITPGMATAVDTGLLSMYLFFLIAVVGIVYTGVRSLVR